jgi:TetR/AcrR family fatty acid metabolism transcriptional regulator
MPSAHLRNRRHAPPEARRAQILEAAMRCFAERGYHATTMDDLARDAGLSKGSLYWHYEGKEDVFLAVAEHVCERLLEALQGASRSTRNVLDLVEESSRRLLELATSPTFLLAWVELVTHRASRERIASLYAESRRELAALLAVGVERGEVRPGPPEAMAGALSATFEGLMFMAAVDPTYDPRAHWEEVWNGLRRGFAA